MLMKKKQAIQHNRQHRKFLSVTILVVLMFGAMDMISLLAEPVYLDDGMTVAFDRKPASIDAEEVLEESPKNAIADFSCIENSQKLEVDGGRVRIRSNSCESFKISDFAITNVSNGYTASVFPIKNNEFTTDFIDLKYGENQVEIKMRTIDGNDTTQSLVVHRRTPASVSK